MVKGMFLFFVGVMITGFVATWGISILLGFSFNPVLSLIVDSPVAGLATFLAFRRR